MNQLYDLREWLVSKIDGAIESYGEDSLISSFINQIDALPSEMGATVEPRGCPTPGACSCPGTIQDVETPVTDAVVKMLEAGWLSLGSSAPGAVKPLIETLEAFERELIDIKQRLLPQYLGRAERAENARQMAVVERDAILEKLTAAIRDKNAAQIAAVNAEQDAIAAEDKLAALSATAAPVAWMYEEDGERMFGHPDGYRPTNAVPLYAAPVEVAAIPKQKLIDLLIRCEIVSRESLDDAENYDNGVTSMNVHNFCMMVCRWCDMKGGQP
jgi:hypothetical protein